MDLVQSDFKVGDSVHYTNGNRIENGIVKSIPMHTRTKLFVVYNCDGEWDKYQDYTAALTHITNLKMSWSSDAINK